jgi:ATP-binding cassette subfamily B protein
MPFLNERDMRLQTHNGALGKFYLDALLGLTPIRTHGAEKSVQREHESLAVEWGRAGLGFHRLMVIVEGLQMLAGFGFAALILMRYISLNQATSWALLLVYWTLNLPVLGNYLVTILQQIPAQRNTVSRLLEPLGALEEKQSPAFSEAMLTPAGIRFQSVHVSASGHAILHDVNLEVQPGEHVAVLGPSGAGKSTFVGLLLGLHRPVSGRLLVNDQPISENITQLNQNTIWIDPTVQIWNRSMYANILYGHTNDQPAALDVIFEHANLMPVLQKLPYGMQTLLGESGGLLSGGEGQRVRLARALNHRTPALVLLDEPCRGLEQAQRRQLLQRMRSTWSDTTLICVTHDVQEALSFDRIVVVQDGRIVDNDAPSVLLQQHNSALLKMIDLERTVRSTVWADSGWRHLSIENGHVREMKNHTPDNGRLKKIAIAKSV